MQQLLGILIVLGCVFGGFALMGGTVTAIWHPVEVLIIVGAAFGALVIGNEKHVLTEMSHQLKKIASRKKHDSEFQRQLLLLMYELLQMAAGGLKALDAHVEAPTGGSVVLAAIMLMTAGTAQAAGSSMPWEGPLQSILESIQGPVARIVAVIIIIATGLALAFGDTSGGFRKLIQIVFGLSIAFAASSFFLSFFSFGGGALV